MLESVESLIMDLPGDLPRAVLNEFRRGWKQREVMAAIEQRQIAVAAPEKVHVDGIGAHTMSIQPDAYFYWVNRLGHKCWADKQFRREYARDNPSVRVRSRSRKTMVQVDGFK